MALEHPVARRVGLVDAVDHLLNRGVVLTGNASISLAGVELVCLGLNLYLASAETLHRGDTVRTARTVSPPEQQPDALAPPPRPGVLTGVPAATALLPPAAATADATPGSGPAALHLAGLPERAAADDQQSAASGLARLVLTLVELLRQVLERQALRRVEGNTLTDDEVERMGLALMELENKMIELRELFGLEEGDLELDLGLLGEASDA